MDCRAQGEPSLARKHNKNLATAELKEKQRGNYQVCSGLYTLQEHFLFSQSTACLKCLLITEHVLWGFTHQMNASPFCHQKWKTACVSADYSLLLLINPLICN